MITEKAYLPVFKRTFIKNFESFETRGTWEVQGDFMGGPFINYLVKDSIKPSKWVMSGETKKIGIYNAYKATITKKVEERVMSFGRPRPGEAPAEPEMRTKEVVMTAWFTPEIPVSSGPSMYGGLPGLILEINDDRTTMLCTKVIINPKEKIKIKEPSKGKQVTNLEYEKIAKDKQEEMQGMYRGRRGGGSRARISN